ncbi:MAG TPA: hypothetical protein VGN75_16130 [Kaistia sp.]|jgi:hypothetical protein|nr:hypothetical protein [Kaistia sp.]
MTDETAGPGLSEGPDNFAIYETGGQAPGRIVQFYQGVAAELAMQVEAMGPGLAGVRCPRDARSETHYVSDRAVILRPSPVVPKTRIVGDDADAVEIAFGRPWSLVLDERAFPVSQPDGDGSYRAVITSPMPAVYRLKINPPWPHVGLTTEIVAS